MEAIIKVQDGDNIKEQSCFFCTESGPYIFGIINSKNKKYNGHIFNGFHCCAVHIDAINRLLDGSYDIDKMITNENLKNFRGGVNLHDDF